MADILTIGKLKELEESGLIDFLLIKNIKLDNKIIGYFAIYSCEALGVVNLYRFGKNEEADKYIKSYDISLYKKDGSEIYSKILKDCEL